MTLTLDTPSTPTLAMENTWVRASWETFLALAEQPDLAHGKFYYYQSELRIETMGVGANHAIENTLMTLAIGLFCMIQNVPVRGLTNASYRKTNVQEAQPDLSYYFGDAVTQVPHNNELIDLDRTPAPNLAIEIAATSLNDDLGKKRLLYEDLGIQEYWVVDVEESMILAFQIKDGGSFRIQTSQVLPNLELSVLEQALRDRKTQDDSQIMQSLLQQFTNYPKQNLP
jgi:Uma2 family endonuclease